jgi:predicted alpha/beta hydrolase family esterase
MPIATKRVFGQTNPYAGFVSSAPVLLVPGLNNSGPLHWQTLWEGERSEFVRVYPRDYAAADLDVWAAAVARAVRAARLAPIIVAHSFGCLATLRAATLGARFRAALLVAPADPDRFDAGTMLPCARLPFPSTVIGSTNDPWLKLIRAGQLATTWGSRLVVFRDAGHINADSGYGPWPDGLRFVRELDREASRTQIETPRNLPRSIIED